MRKKINDELFEAVEKGDAKKVKELINVFFLNKFMGRSPDVNAYDDNDNTPLLLAAYKGNREIVDLLIKAGAKIDEQDKYGNTVLVEATKKGHAEIVRELISLGADFESVDKNGYTALMAASSLGHIKVIEELLKAGADINAVDKEGHTALSEAAANDLPEAVKYLLEKGADPAKNGMTKLMIACILDDTETIRAILEQSPEETGKRDYLGATPLMWACRDAGAVAVKLLLEAGAYPDITDINKNSAVYIAALKGKYDVLGLLCEAGADVNSRARLGVTPLIAAAREGSPECIKILLANGAAVNDKDLTGHTALMSIMNAYSYRPEHEKCAELLIDAGANLNFRDDTGNTALMWAARLGYPSIVRLLIKHGADFNSKNNAGKKAIDLAKDDESAAILMNAEAGI